MNEAHSHVAVVIAGSGYLDGTEITEAIATLINLDQQGLTYQCYAPNMDFDPVNHISGEPAGPARNLLTEAARICRGAVKPLSELTPQHHRALALPGGYGAAKSLSSFATSDEPSVLPDLAAAIQGFHEGKKPILAMCIAPALLALTLGKQGITLTIGSDAGTAAKLESLGCHHQSRAVDEIAVDEAHRIITTPAYMFDTSPAKVNAGIAKATATLATWLKA